MYGPEEIAAHHEDPAIFFGASRHHADLHRTEEVHCDVLESDGSVEAALVAKLGERGHLLLTGGRLFPPAPDARASYLVCQSASLVDPEVAAGNRQQQPAAATMLELHNVDEMQPELGEGVLSGHQRQRVPSQSTLDVDDSLEEARLQRAPGVRLAQRLSFPEEPVFFLPSFDLGPGGIASRKSPCEPLDFLSEGEDPLHDAYRVRPPRERLPSGLLSIPLTGGEGPEYLGDLGVESKRSVWNRVHHLLLPGVGAGEEGWTFPPQGGASELPLFGAAAGEISRVLVGFHVSPVPWAGRFADEADLSGHEPVEVARGLPDPAEDVDTIRPEEGRERGQREDFA